MVVKNLAADVGNARDKCSIPGLERSSGEGNGYLLQYSCLENPMDRGIWRAVVHGVAKSQIHRVTEHAHTHTHTHTRVSGQCKRDLENDVFTQEFPSNRKITPQLECGRQSPALGAVLHLPLALPTSLPTFPQGN